MRGFVATFLALVIGAGVALADEMKAKVKSVDADKMTITVTDDQGKEHVINLAADVKVIGPQGKVQKEGLKSSRLKEGANVTVIYEAKEGAKTATELKILKKQ